jgi:hypothetical protein
MDAVDVPERVLLRAALMRVSIWMPPTQAVLPEKQGNHVQVASNNL